MKKVSKYTAFSIAKAHQENLLGRTLTQEEQLDLFIASSAFTRKSASTLEDQEAKRQFNAMLSSVKLDDGVRRFMKSTEKETIDLLTEEDPEKLEEVANAQEPSIKKMQKNVKKARSIAYMLRNQMRMDLEQLRKVD